MEKKNIVYTIMSSLIGVASYILLVTFQTGMFIDIFVAGIMSYTVFMMIESKISSMMDSYGDWELGKKSNTLLNLILEGVFIFVIVVSATLALLSTVILGWTIVGAILILYGIPLVYWIIVNLIYLLIKRPV